MRGIAKRVASVLVCHQAAQDGQSEVIARDRVFVRACGVGGWALGKGLLGSFAVLVSVAAGLCRYGFHC